MNTHVDSPRLPPELLGQIIDNLRYQKGALANASLVSHTFLVLCRPHLFHSLKVPPIQPVQKELEKLGILGARNTNKDMRLLAESAIGVHVRDLHVELSRILTIGLDIAVLISFLRRMTQLEAFTISSISLNPHRIGLGELPSDFSSAISNVFRVCPIVSVNISRVNDFPYLILSHCSLLKRVVLNSPMFLETALALDEHLPTQDPLEVETLELSHTIRSFPFPIDVISHPHSPLVFSKLAHLKIISGTSEDHRTWQQLIDSAQNSLCNFEIRVSGSNHFLMFSASSPSSITLESCLLLRRISIQVQWPLMAPFSWLMGILNTVYEINSIEEIVLNLGSSMVSAENWQELDSILTSPKFECLKALFLAVPPPQLNHKMPALIARGIVQLSHGKS
ncbi:hypothetical protein BDZ94DRAFT_1266572 [Collybia nuda]|uniref:F-box domain-containing protein n=1 Tax=Collybia nuda TaxID=64659 RepID=A0A9P5Y2L0_9AGAR|nr:hypothetical protein BDZ94DRAFT_1266572 [Collybia nuda]